jgi:hypothetical protein
MPKPRKRKPVTSTRAEHLEAIKRTQAETTKILKKLADLEKARKKSKT